MKITITEKEYDSALTYINNRKNGVLSDYMPTGPDDPFASVLNKASQLEEELDAYDETGDDLLLWFINQYHIQEGKPLII